MRYFTDIGLPQKIIKSLRYKPYASELCQPVNQAGFKGVWVVRNGFDTSERDPSKSDIVIFYLHGGGYCSGSSASYTLLMLRLAESIIRAGRTVSIFTLDYDLAPESPFPTQLVQARKAYDWLTGSQQTGGIGIDRAKLVVMGDSAGGHLSLSLLADKQKPLSTETREIAGNIRGDKTSELGVVLLSPWLNMTDTPDSFTRNALTDIISGTFLDRCIQSYTGRGGTTVAVSKERPWVNWVDAKGEIAWDEVLPDWVWVSGGKCEIFYDDVIRWVKDRENDCQSKGSGRNSRIESELDRNEPHDYAWLKTLEDGASRKFLSKPLKSDKGNDDFDATERIGAAIAKRWEAAFGTA